MKFDNIKLTKFDNLQTQNEAIKFLLDNVEIKKGSVIWECAVGDGKIKDYLEKEGYEVIGTDKEQSFLETKVDSDYIITNPPFSLKNRFLERAFNLKKPFAFLLPLTTLEGNFRNELFRNKNIQLLIPNKRFDFTGKRNCWFATAWFCWKMKLPKQINFRKIK